MAAVGMPAAARGQGRGGQAGNPFPGVRILMALRPDASAHPLIHTGSLHRIFDSRPGQRTVPQLDISRTETKPGLQS